MFSVLWLLIWENELVTSVQILANAVYISLCADSLGEGMKPSVLFPAIGR